MVLMEPVEQVDLEHRFVLLRQPQVVLVVEVSSAAVAVALVQLEQLGANSMTQVLAVAVLVGISAFWIKLSAREIAAAQHTREAVEAGEM